MATTNTAPGNCVPTAAAIRESARARPPVSPARLAAGTPAPALGRAHPTMERRTSTPNPRPPPPKADDGDWASPAMQPPQPLGAPRTRRDGREAHAGVR